MLLPGGPNLHEIAELTGGESGICLMEVCISICDVERHLENSLVPSQPVWESGGWPG